MSPYVYLNMVHEHRIEPDSDKGISMGAFQQQGRHYDSVVDSPVTSLREALGSLESL